MADDHPLARFETLVLIGLGGFAGANLRYVVGLLLPGLSGTFVANVTGSLVLGFVLYEARYTAILAEETHLVVATGFLSSYTTYSTFALETVQATPAMGVLNVLASYVVGFGAVLVGRAGAALVEG